MIVQINEAFAPQTIACQKALDLNPDILNVNGGAIAVGHPLAASGSRITSHIVHYLRYVYVVVEEFLYESTIQFIWCKYCRSCF